jgi:predicted transcriptional regulator
MIKRSCTFTVRLTPGELHQLSALAKKLDDSQANACRRAIAEHYRVVTTSAKKGAT